MGKLIVTEFVTLDGVAQAPGRPDEDDAGGFTHGGWQAPLASAEGDNVFEEAKSMDALLLGRRTYEIFANYWPTAPDRIGHLSQWRVAAHLRHRRSAHIRPDGLAGADERMRLTRLCRPMRSDNPGRLIAGGSLAARSK